MLRYRVNKLIPKRQYCNIPDKTQFLKLSMELQKLVDITPKQNDELKQLELLMKTNPETAFKWGNGYCEFELSGCIEKENKVVYVKYKFVVVSCQFYWSFV